MTGGGVVAALVWGDVGWRTPAIVFAFVLLALIGWGYARATLSGGTRTLAIALKSLGIAILLLCLLEPLWSSTRARPGANLFAVLADNSRSMTLHDGGAPQSRGDQIRPATTQPASWLRQIGEDFDVRVHRFDTTLRPSDNLSALTFDGDASNLAASLSRLARQYQGRPLAGVLLLTDGRATDADAIDRVLDSSDARLPPVYPVLIGQDAPARDINLQRVDVSQTDFEDAPVTVVATLSADGYRGREVAVQLSEDGGALVEEQTLPVAADGGPLVARFKLRPKSPGVSFYKVSVAGKGKAAADDSGEATLANNTRLVTVDRGRGPYRVLYVGGRPNWEFKFLKRAVDEDDQIELVGLLRIAKREPKFAYIGRAGDASNPLFRGFDNKDAEQAEQYDQPVLVRLGTKTANELRSGFPRTAEELNAFTAVVLDDVEAEFFTQDQLLLLKEFVRQRGGGLLMLGGQESFREGKYDRTPVGDVLPVYASDTEATTNAQYRLSLTREGWLAPWVRLRSDEAAERSRVAGMPPFQIINGVRGVKPGATVLASADVTNDGGQTARTVPALIEQRFGKGRGAALLIGDLWRWTMRRPANTPDDLSKAWRQTIRWLTSDVPKRVDIAVPRRTESDDAGESRTVQVRVRDAAFGPQDGAAVSVRVTTPDGKAVDLPADASAAEAGLYEAMFVPRSPGAYRVKATAADPEGREIAVAEAGWTSEPAADEFNDLRPDRALLERIATKTGGRMVALSGLDAFARTLPTLRAEITDPDVRPLWHSPWVLAAAVVCLAAEWGLRRWKGLP